MAMVSWSPPTSDRGSPILSYTLTVSDGRRVTVDASITSVTFDDQEEDLLNVHCGGEQRRGPGGPSLGDASRRLIAIDASCRMAGR
jgi:hypothetical protein